MAATDAIYVQINNVQAMIDSGSYPDGVNKAAANSYIGLCRTTAKWLGGKALSDISKLLTLATNDSYSDAFGVANGIYGSMAAIGVGLMLCFLLVKMLSDYMTHGMPTFESIAKHTAYFIVGYILIVHGWDIMMGVIAFSDSILTDYFSGLGKGTGSDTTFDTAIGLWSSLVEEGNGDDAMKSMDLQTYASGYKTLGEWGKIGFDARVSIYAIIATMLNVLYYWAYVVAATRVVKVMIYLIVSPLILSDFATGPSIMESHSIHFLKQLFAICMSGAICLMVLFFVTILNVTLLNVDGISAIVMVVLLRVATFTLVNQSDSIAQQIFGGR